MLVDILLKFILYLIEIVLWALPSWTLPEFIITAFNYFMLNIASLSRAFPFMFSVIVSLSLIVIFKVSVIVANISIGFIALIRGSGKPEI